MSLGAARINTASAPGGRKFHGSGAEQCAASTAQNSGNSRAGRRPVPAHGIQRRPIRGLSGTTSADRHQRKDAGVGGHPIMSMNSDVAPAVAGGCPVGAWIAQIATLQTRAVQRQDDVSVLCTLQNGDIGVWRVIVVALAPDGTTCGRSTAPPFGPPPTNGMTRPRWLAETIGHIQPRRLIVCDKMLDRARWRSSGCKGRSDGIDSELGGLA